MITTPFTPDIDRHPIFVRDARRVHWGVSPDDLRRYSWRIALITQVVMLLVWLLLIALLFFSTPPYMRGSETFLFVTSFNAAGLLMAVTVLAGLVLDFASMQAAVHSISGEVNARRWDLLRLTALHVQGIASAKYAVAQLRVWRMMVIMVSARVAAIWIMLLIYFVLPPLMLGSYAFDHLAAFFAAPLENTVLLGIGVLTAIIYVLEPYWRMKAMTAMGMMVSTYELNTALAMLAGVGIIFAVWLLQLIIAASLIFGLGLLATLFFISSSALLVLGYLLLSAVVIGLTIYGFYSIVSRWGLRRVVWRIAHGWSAT